MTQQGQALAAMRPNPAPMKPGMPMPKMADGGSVDDMRRAIANAAKSAGMKAPVVANKNLTTVDDFRQSLGDRVRERATNMQDTIESMPYKYDVGHHVFTEDSARKNWPPMKILAKRLSGNKPMREGDPFIGKPIKDPATGKTKRTPYEPGYHVRLEHSPEEWSEFTIPESAIVGKLAAGGSVKAKAYSPLDKLVGQTYAKGGKVEKSKYEVLPYHDDEGKRVGWALNEGDYTHDVYPTKTYANNVMKKLLENDALRTPPKMAKGGTVSRETIKGKVTMSPNMDVMRYELHNRKAK